MAFLAFMLLVLPMLAMSIENTNMMSNNMAKPGCQTKCGSLTVPYPFGIGIDDGCSIHPIFDIRCNTSSNPPIAYLNTGATNVLNITTKPMEVIDISTSQIRIRNVLASKCYEENGELSAQQLVFLNTRVSFFTLSENDNKLILIGCDDLAMVFGFSLYEGKNFSTGCMTTCSRGQDVSNNGTCSGIGCCLAVIPKGLTTYLGFLNSPRNHTNVWSFNPCSYAFLGDHEKFTFRGTSDFMDPNFVDRIVSDVPIVIDWVIGTKNCSVVRNSTTYSCMEHSLCIDSESGRGGYRCICEEGYDGNPYLSPGCQDEKQSIDLTLPNKEKSLAAYFKASMKENRLFQILHHRVLKEGSLDQLNAMSELVVRCLNIKGEERPTMREVVNALEGFTKYNIRSWAHDLDQENDQLQMGEMISEQNDLYIVLTRTSNNSHTSSSSVQQSSEYNIKHEEDNLDNIS
ncbi:hypothetical protein H5410_028004 [Solanum commersonii]|uniref:EGF-like domain-containing protein n=1 Tax=Solanum commersonii TaxID=4109 RepID=A0A9J5Z3J8_SOLCO|nr:hypothetical protein H5410_028004 [Solanum commersonii]